MKLALDTNAYRELREGGTGLADVVRQAEVIGLPIIVIGELRFGFMNGSRLRENGDELARFMAQPRVRVLLVDDETTHRFGEIFTALRQAGRPMQQNDVWIAALCQQHRFTLATRDRGFRHVLGLSLLDAD